MFMRLTLGGRGKMALGNDKYKNMHAGFSGHITQDGLIYSVLTHITMNIKLFLSSVCSDGLGPMLPMLSSVF